MEDNPFNPDDPAWDELADKFDAALELLSTNKYKLAAASFADIIAQYDSLGGEKDQAYHTLVFFHDFSMGLSTYQEADFANTEKILAFAKTRVTKLSPTLQELFLPELEILLKIIPLDDRFKKLLNSPGDFDHFTNELFGIFEKLSDLMVDAPFEGASDRTFALITAKTNIIGVLLYVLGKTPVVYLEAVIRADSLDEIPSDPASLVQWVLNQEQMVLLEIGFQRVHETIPAVSFFANELIKLGAPAKLKEIPPETKTHLLTLLTPLKFLDGGLSKEYIKSFVTETISTLKDTLKEERNNLRSLMNIPFAPSKAKNTHGTITAKFPTPKKSTWPDLTIKFVDGQTIKASIGKIYQKLNYAQMGFQDERIGKPDVYWETLVELSENNGEITWDSPGAGKHIKQRIYVIACRLKAVFGIEGHPFYPYKNFKAYKTRFKMEMG